ncbi:MAG: CDP-alcohol phosphatidyltransferase family protein [Deltaproteobacteria bacterium]|nr:CDP-alcohol phosphatidyltransferase family protein [Deltaproteobacteria bacterium]MBN2673653.1 CDP-alcohol phosphatidyltransferase family protein [Deltaproteobacteria bacterium]
MKITANMVTIARIVLMPIPGYLLYQNIPELYVALAAIILLGVTDWIDGKMARRDGPTVLGGLLDPIADKIFIAVCFLPFAERVLPGTNEIVFPVWLLILVFCRDFLVTSLRTSLSLRDAPMRTSTLAKFKTAIQMTAVGYILAIVIGALHAPGTLATFYVFGGASLIPILFILFRLIIKRKSPGLRSGTMAGLMVGYAAVFYFFSIEWSMAILVYSVTALTVFSGFSYLADTWSALKGQPGGSKEWGRFILEGILVPTAFLLCIGRFETTGMSSIIILAITLELATGGLANLLASKKMRLKFRWMATKSIAEVLLAGGAFAISRLSEPPSFPIGQLLLTAAAAVALLNAVVSFYRHRRVYLDSI